MEYSLHKGSTLPDIYSPIKYNDTVIDGNQLLPYEFKWIQELGSFMIREMKKMPISDVALPTGVSKLTKFMDKRHSNKKIYGDGTIFTDTHKGTPVHVKAAIKYNDLLKHFGADNTEPIRNKEKIRWAYMKKNPLGIDALAFKGYDDPKQITDFIQKYMDYDRLFVGALQKKIYFELGVTNQL